MASRQKRQKTEGQLGGKVAVGAATAIGAAAAIEEEEEGEIWDEDIRIFFFGLVVAVCGKPREPYNRGGRIWSLAVRTNRAFRNKPAASASKLRQTAHLAISL